VLAASTNRSRRRGSGAGLGLSIASGIVAAHGGRLELTPTARGTCFVITLPVERSASTAATPIAALPGAVIPSNTVTPDNAVTTSDAVAPSNPTGVKAP
jgi:hypothetical protein